MVSRILILVCLFISFKSHSGIIYDKNEIVITEIELNKYLEIYKETLNIDLKKNEAIKKIVLIKKTIQSLSINNEKYLLSLDKKIQSEFGIHISNEQIKLDFIRYTKIRNEFISNYFINNFSTSDLREIFNSVDNLTLPISKNNCLIIDSIEDLKEDEVFVKNFYENFKNNKTEFKTIKDTQTYSVCINNENLRKIENLIINFIDKKTQDDFNKFVYGQID